MKTIGLIGGMSWESTVLYYQIINTTVKETLGGLHSAKCIVFSLNFQEIEMYQSSGEWGKCADILIDAGKKLEKSGADFLIICTNTMHIIADKVQENITIPILHIADVTAEKLIKDNIHKVALLGTKYTMEQDFYKQKLFDKGLSVIIPGQEDRLFVNNTIYNELCLGIISEESKRSFYKIANKLVLKGAEGVILGCTEIGLLMKQEETTICLFDTTFIHAQNAALIALGIS